MSLKCILCEKSAEFCCPCAYVPLCSEHLIGHITQPGQHACEHLNILLSPSETESLKKELCYRIQIIEASKKKISTFSADLIKTLKNSKNSAIEKLNSLSQFYISLMAFDKLSNSLKTQIDKLKTSTLLIKEMPLELKEDIIKAFSQDFVSNEENGKAAIGNSVQEKISEIKVQEKIDWIQFYGFGNGPVDTPLNSWPLQKKMAYMESFKIDHYQEWFGLYSEKRWPLDEIKFSNDKKLAFLRKFYGGIYK